MQKSFILLVSVVQFLLTEQLDRSRDSSVNIVTKLRGKRRRNPSSISETDKKTLLHGPQRGSVAPREARWPPFCGQWGLFPRE
jgi:hypothetical protein